MGLVTWKEWSSGLLNGILGISDEELERTAHLLLTADLILTAGNGGSSAIASHFAQALAKPDYKAGGGIAAICLSDNVPTLTAHANDGGWGDALVETAKPFLEAVKNSIVVAISSSGRSENVCRLARLARDQEHVVVAFTGFDGEPLRSIATVALHVNSHDYEVVEPVHCALIHRTQAYIRALTHER